MRKLKWSPVAHQEAIDARQNAYAPYSKFKVGAAVVTKDGFIFTGCNIENASYGGTVCAERVAILQAVANGHHEFMGIMVVTDSPHPAVPCALCLQTMAEFFSPSTEVHVANLKSVKMKSKFSQLLAKPFGPKQLRSAK